MPDTTPPEQPASGPRPGRVTAADVRAKIATMGERWQYHAFISYSRTPDQRLARALRRALRSVGSRWWERGRLRVFLDAENLATGSDLLGRLQHALDGSAHMILLANRASAGRPYVQQEAAHYRATRPDEDVILVHTGDTLAWSAGAGDFDPATDALPPVLHGAYRREPVWATLTPAVLRPLRRRAAIRRAAAALAADILEVDPEQLGHVEVRRHRWRLATVSGGFVVALVAGLIGGNAYLDNLQEQAIAASSLLSTAAHAARADGDHTAAAQFDAAAWLRHTNDSAKTDLLNDQNTPLQTLIPAAGGAFSPDGQLLVATGTTQPARIWNATGTVPAADLPRPVDLPRFVPGTRILLARDREHPATVLRWDLADPAKPAALAPIDTGFAKITALITDPAGKRLAVGADSGHVRLWDLPAATAAGPGFAGTGEAGEVTALAFSTDGTRLAVGSTQGSIDLWRLNGAEPEHLDRPVPPTGSTQFRITFGPDADSAVILDDNSNAFRWVLRDDPDRIQYTGSHHLALGGAYTAALSPDGSTLAAMANDGTLQLWNMAFPTDPLPLTQPLKPVPPRFQEAASFPDRTSLTFSPDGRSLLADLGTQPAILWHLPTTYFPAAGLISTVKGSATADALLAVDDGTVTGLYTLTDPPRLTTLTSESQAGTAVAASADGRVIAAGYDDATPAVRIHYGDGHTTTATIALPGGELVEVTALALNRDGTTLAVATGANPPALYLIDLRDPAAKPKPVKFPVRTSSDITALAFTADGRRLAVSGSDLQIRDLQGGTVTLTGGGAADTLAFTLDGTGLAAGIGGLTVSLWNVDIPAPLATLPEAPQVNGPPKAPIAFSPDGRTLAAGATDGMVRLWDVTDRAHPALIGNPLLSSVTTQDRYITSRRYVVGVQTVGWSADGAMLAAVNVDGTVRLWHTDPRRIIDRICTATGANLTEATWRKYAPTLDYEPPCDRPAGAAPIEVKVPEASGAPASAAATPGGPAAACKAADLDFAYGKKTESQFGGQFTVALEITNKSGAACGLFGAPNVTLTGPPHDLFGPTYIMRGEPRPADGIVLAAGAKAHVDLTYLLDGPETSWQPDKVNITLSGGGGTLSLPWPANTPVVRQDAASMPGTFVGTYLLSP
ncbi:DUF4232 domain-containing protein [Catellatospora tritici]|uniref:DUF4232 domain-containing protein n=1 Tax=Catellatospora tritici TaxID=2851566 RepID=UPI001C2DDF4C|nr:DUF4232 domain-containing protein [Catellatospora tritici]MBV1855825.1 DUF4232 domain-containing protein [Catellatospora tritici]